MTEDIFCLHLRVRYTRPEVWSRILVPQDMTLTELHWTVQRAMGWTGRLEGLFLIDSVDHEPLDHESWSRGAYDLTLEDVDFEDELVEYDYGTPDWSEYWRVDIDAEARYLRDPATRYPHYVVGSAARAREDGPIPGEYTWRRAGRPA